MIPSLAEEIASGPLAEELAPHVADGNDGAIAEILNAPRYLAYGTVSRARFAIWCGSTGLRAAIQTHADSSDSPLRSIALTVVDFLRGAAEGIEFALPENRAMLAAWVQAGAITQTQEEDLLALSQVAQSRAQQIGVSVSVADVAQALRGTK